MLCNVKNCTGCGACSGVCPQNCIEICQSNEGYYIPSVNEESCVKCGICEKTCPISNSIDRKERILPKVYRAHSLDEDILRNSASGGIASVLNKYYTEKLHGYVCGVEYNKDFLLIYNMVDNYKDAKKFAHSKYVQSYTGDIYARIKKKLNAGEKVFFCGLPCQVAGLYAYLGKEYDNLLTADIVCHGTSSSKLFQEYIQYVELKLNSKIKNICHTSKEHKWNILIQKLICIETVDGKKHYIEHWKDSYLFCFLNNIMFKSACYECKHQHMPRVADITLGDFYGLGTIYPVKDLNPLGESMIMVNTQKGEKALKEIKDVVYLEERKLEEAMYFNHNLWRPSKPHKNHEAFEKDIVTLSYEELSSKYYNKMKQSNLNRMLRNLIIKVFGHSFVAKGVLFINKRNGITEKVDDIIEELKKEFVHEM